MLLAALLFLNLATTLQGQSAEAASLPPPAEAAPDFPEAEDHELLALAGLAPIGGGRDIARYVLRRGWGYQIQPSARIVQAEWPYEGSGPPQVLSIELAHRNGAWRVTERRQAAIHPLRFEQLLRNLTAAAATIGGEFGRGSGTYCSHVGYSRLDLSLSDGRSLRLSRSAHCSDDAPAVVAGELLIGAVELNLRLNWRPDE